jgi:hypothetical protein
LVAEQIKEERQKMSERWNVAFMKGTEQVGETQTVEADDYEQARFVAEHMYPELDAASDGTLVMEEHELSPTESLRHIGNVWNELRALQKYSNLTPMWDDMGASAQAAFTYYLRNYCPLEMIVKTVTEMDSENRQVN